MSKFNSELAETLYEQSLECGPDEEIGSVDELGWFGLFEDELVILQEDSQGFVYAHQQANLNQNRLFWAIVENSYRNYYDEEGE